MTITFIGHRDTPQAIRESLHDTLISLIKKQDNLHFLIGHQGAFDRMALCLIQQCKAQYPNITYTVVLSHYPQSPQPADHTIFPSEVAAVPKRWAISARNRYMIQRSDIVITYVADSSTNAAMWEHYAKRHHKPCIALGPYRSD